MTPWHPREVPCDLRSLPSHFFGPPDSFHHPSITAIHPKWRCNGMVPRSQHEATLCHQTPLQESSSHPPCQPSVKRPILNGFTIQAQLVFQSFTVFLHPPLVTATPGYTGRFPSIFSPPTRIPGTYWGFHSPWVTRSPPSWFPGPFWYGLPGSPPAHQRLCMSSHGPVLVTWSPLWGPQPPQATSQACEAHQVPPTRGPSPFHCSSIGPIHQKWTKNGPCMGQK